MELISAKPTTITSLATHAHPKLGLGAFRANLLGDGYYCGRTRATMRCAWEKLHLQQIPVAKPTIAEMGNQTFLSQHQKLSGKKRNPCEQNKSVKIVIKNICLSWAGK